MHRLRHSAMHSSLRIPCRAKSEDCTLFRESFRAEEPSLLRAVANALDCSRHFKKQKRLLHFGESASLESGFDQKRRDSVTVGSAGRLSVAFGTLASNVVEMSSAPSLRKTDSTRLRSSDVSVWTETR